VNNALAANAQGYDFQLVWPKTSTQTSTGDTSTFSAIFASAPKYTISPDKILTVQVDLEISGPVNTVAGS
jgi:hypothetical protein